LKRIVSLEPNATSILFALDRADCVVGVSKWCNRLVDIGDRPRLSTTWCAQAKEIVALSPDLVIASVPYRSESVCELLQAGLDVLCLYPRRLQDVYRHIICLGRLTDAAAEAERLVASMEADLASVRAEARGLPRPRVYAEMWPDPMMSSPAWVAELIEIAGGEFVPGEPGRQVTHEEILQADPEVILVAWAGIAQPSLAEVTSRPGWHATSAVRSGRVFDVDEILLNVPGPNLVRAAQLLLARIHQAVPHNEASSPPGQDAQQ
jgi:iron complex transport system substrate-binding protein